MRERLRRTMNREVTMPRWAIVVDFFYRVFLVVSACVVLVLWFQAATRDEEADRNARIQTCSASYAATTAAWDARVLLLAQRAESFDRHAETLFSQLVASAGTDIDLDPADLRAYERAQERAEQATAAAQQAANKVDQMTRLRIGLAEFSVASVSHGNEFECPPLPEALEVEGSEVE